jgi:hypothetical protein
MDFVVKKRLTIPLLKLTEGNTQYVKITAPMHLGKEQKAKDGEKKKEPAMLANCVNLQDGSECQIILSAVVKSVLEDEYPNSAYVGKCFAITKQGRAPGKSYNQFDVVEIEDPAAAAAPARAVGGRGR